MATIRKKGNSQWHVQIRRKGFPTVTRTFDSEKKAKIWSREVESTMDKGVFLDRSVAERTTLDEVIDDFLLKFAPHQYKQRAEGNESFKIQCAHLQNRLGEYSLAAIDQKLICEYRDKRLAEKWNGKQISGSTVKKELNMLSKLLGYAEKELGIDLPRGNPVRRVRMPKEGQGRDRRLTADEWERLSVECRNSRNKELWPVVQLAIFMGARQGEILNLKWKDINLDRKVALLRNTKNGEDRGVPLSSQARNVLEALSVSNTRENVFRVQRMALYHAYIAAVKRAGIQDLTFHDLRHEGLSRLSENTSLNTIELSLISGHKTLKMLKKYVHLSAEKLAEKLE